MTNLLISYPDIPFRASTYSVYSDNTSYPFNNLFTGERVKRWEPTSAFQYEIISGWDLGSATTSSANHLILARANLLKAQGCRQVQLVSDTVSGGGGFTSRFGTNNLQNKTLDGVRGEDVIFTPTYNTDYGGVSTSSHRYWWLYLGYFGGPTPQKWTCSKIYFGTFFDFGREPSYPAIQNRSMERPGNRDAVYRFSLTWQGITNTKRNELFDKILQYRDVNPVFLYDTDDLILNGIKLLHCRILDASITPITAQYNDVEILFEELI